MKRGLITVMLLLGFGSMHAEYDGWFLHIQMQTQSEYGLNGYVYVANAYFDPDSAQSQSYLLRILDQMDYNANDTIQYFRQLLSYPHYDLGTEEKGVIHGMVGQAALAISEIRHIEVLEYIPQSYLIGISSPHVWEDMEWMSKAPVETHSEGGYFCDWQILLHENNSRTLEIIEELNVYNEAFEAKRTELEEILKYADGEDFRETEEELRQMDEQIDEDKFNILQQFDGMKVVIISFCSC